MSHRGMPGWYPECEECDCGNLEKVVCIDCFKEIKEEIFGEIEKKDFTKDIGYSGSFVVISKVEWNKLKRKKGVDGK